ncbi:MAG: replication factor C small subunit [archaeon]|nr:MAG: replication factor C small subunit [archaeon]
MADISVWTEKYRPQKFEDLEGQKQIIKRVKAFVEAKNMPHLLFAGPAGSGKTTLALIVAKTLFGDSWRDNFLELNASDERGIDVVRQKVKSFARTRAFSGDFKIIFLDEADALTRDAQQALRRTMEQFTQTCRFILSCNYSSKIIDPIQSRCAIFRFKNREQEDLKNAVEKIAKEEKLKINDKAIEALFDVSQGDLRKVMNVLQASAMIDKDINDKLVYETVAETRPQDVQKILQLAIQGKFQDSRNFLLDMILKQGLSSLDVVKSIQKELWNLKISDEAKIDMVQKCAEIEFRLVEGSDSFIQLEALLASFYGKK